MLKHAQGNLIDMAEQQLFHVIVHGCNCQNTMGSGLAKEIKERYPLAYEADCLAAKMWKSSVARLANFSTATVVAPNGRPFIIINAYTQLNYLPRDKDHFDYEAFQVILRKLEALDPNKDIRFGFPYIGMGLAGGDASRIIPMIADFATRHDTTLVEYEA